MTPSEFIEHRRKHKVALLDLAQKSGLDPMKLSAFELGDEPLPDETVQMLVSVVRKTERRQ